MKFLKELERLLVSVIASPNVFDELGKLEEVSEEEMKSQITTLSQLVTMAVAIVLIMVFYPFIPRPLFFFVVPSVLLGSWFIATKVVANTVIKTFDSLVYNSLFERTDEESVQSSNIFAKTIKQIGETLKHAPNFALMGVFVCVSLFVIGMLFNQMK